MDGGQQHEILMRTQTHQRYQINFLLHCIAGYALSRVNPVNYHPRASILSFRFFSNCFEKQLSSLLCLDLDWHSLLWINAHGHWIITIFITCHNIAICHRLGGISPLIQPRSETKLFCFFAMISPSLAGFWQLFCFGFPLLILHQFCSVASQNSYYRIKAHK